MGFFDKLTEKKTCAICGKELGLLGKTKLADGYLCKDCARKLSPFFDEARSSTVEQIEQQLAYREQNKETLASFSPTRELGGTWRIYIDDQMQALVVSRSSDWRAENADVIPFSQLGGVDVRIDEDRREIYDTDQDGGVKSYNPPRYESEFDFWITIRVRNPYFNTIEFKVNDWPIDNRWSPAYDRSERTASEMRSTLRELGQAGAAPAVPMSTTAPSTPPPSASGSGAPQQTPRFCSNCGTPVTPGAHFCESCGSQLAS